MNLKEIRKNKNLTATELAVKIGISQGQYSNIERGTRNASQRMRIKIAQAFDIPLEDLNQILLTHAVQSYKVNSWVSGIRINGLPLLKAFGYYIETKGNAPTLLNDHTMKQELKNFIEANIGFSVLAELSENKQLLNNIRRVIAVNTKSENIYAQHGTTL
jgi:transcriptional regulator with XRE-family HTH domain